MYARGLGEGHGSVAIKRLDAGGMQGEDEFVAEIAFLAELLHPNLVRLLGYAHAEGASGGERALVYELLAGGALDDRARARARRGAAAHVGAAALGRARRRARPAPPALEGARRLDARRERQARARRGPRGEPRDGAHPLRHQVGEHPARRARPPSCATLGSCASARARADGGAVAAHTTASLRGSWGYICPEYARTGRVSTKVDVYACGVVMLELLTGLPAIDERYEPRGDLVARVQPKLAALASSGGGAAAAAAADALLDAHARGWPADSAAGFAEITGACLAASARRGARPREMLGAVVSLESLALEKAAESALNSGAAAEPKLGAAPAAAAAAKETGAPRGRGIAKGGGGRGRQARRAARLAGRARRRRRAPADRARRAHAAQGEQGRRARRARRARRRAGPDRAARAAAGRRGEGRARRRRAVRRGRRVVRAARRARPQGGRAARALERARAEQRRERGRAAGRARAGHAHRADGRGGGGGGARAKREMMPVMVTLPAAGETFEEPKSDAAPVVVRVLQHVAVGSLSDAKGGDLDDPDFDF